MEHQLMIVRCSHLDLRILPVIRATTIPLQEYIRQWKYTETDFRDTSIVAEGQCVHQ